MTYVRLDDQFTEHPKIEELWAAPPWFREPKFIGRFVLIPDNWDERLDIVALSDRAFRVQLKELFQQSRTERRAKQAATKHRRRARVLSASGDASGPAITARIAYYGGRCWRCGGSADSIDHVKPLARGGSNWPSNLRPICRPCNSRKGARWP